MDPITLGLIGGGTLLQGLGMFGAGRNANRMKNYARNFELDKTPYMDGLRNLQSDADMRKGVGRDLRTSGVGMDRGQFEGQHAMRGAGRNAFGKLFGEESERAEIRSGDFVNNAMDNRREGRRREKMTLLQGLAQMNMAQGQIQAGMMGQAYGSAMNQSGQLADFGAGLVGQGVSYGLNNQFYSKGGGYGRMLDMQRQAGMFDKKG